MHPPVVKALVVYHKPARLIAQKLHHVVGGVHEHEDVPTVKVLPDSVVHYAAQYVESFPHVQLERNWSPVTRCGCETTATDLHVVVSGCCFYATRHNWSEAYGKNMTLFFRQSCITLETDDSRALSESYA